MTYESGKLIELSGIVRLKLNGREMGGGGVVFITRHFTHSYSQISNNIFCLYIYTISNIGAFLDVVHSY